jgi:hypothetical protein
MDDWSLLPSRNAASEPAPNPQSTMTNTPTPARLARPRQAPPTGADHPRPQHTALDPARLARQPRNQSGATPQNPSDFGPHGHLTSRNTARTSTTVSQPLDTSRPFMDDTGRPRTEESRRGRRHGCVAREMRKPNRAMRTAAGALLLFCGLRLLVRHGSDSRADRVTVTPGDPGIVGCVQPTARSDPRRSRECASRTAGRMSTEAREVATGGVLMDAGPGT